MDIAPLQLIPLKAYLKKLIPERYRYWPRQVYLTLRSLWYLGNRFLCPCCNGHFRKFLPYSYRFQSRANAVCPKCGSLERHRLLWIYLREKTTFFKDNLKVLDIAPMPFFQQRCKALPNIDYFSADISSPLAMLKIDITDISLPDNQFDCIICLHVLEHIPDDQKAIRELFRVMKPGGWAILQSPVDPTREKTFEDAGIVSPEERERVYGQFNHVRIYGADYRSRLEKAGFEVRAHNCVQEFGHSVISKCGLIRNDSLRNEVIYFCLKPW